MPWEQTEYIGYVLEYTESFIVYFALTKKILAAGYELVMTVSYFLLVHFVKIRKGMIQHSDSTDIQTSGTFVSELN